MLHCINKPVKLFELSGIDSQSTDQRHNHLLSVPSFDAPSPFAYSYPSKLSVIKPIAPLHLLQLTGTLLDTLIEGGPSRIGTLTQVPRLDRDQLAYIYFPACREFALGSDAFATSCHHWWESLRQNKQDHLAECVFRLTKPAKTNREKEELEKAIDLVLDDVSQELGLDFAMPSRGLVYTWPAQIEGLFYCQKLMRLFASRMNDHQASFSLAMIELLACSAIDGDKRGLKWNVLCAGFALQNDGVLVAMQTVGDIFQRLIAAASTEINQRRIIQQIKRYLPGFEMPMNSGPEDIADHDRISTVLEEQLQAKTIKELKELYGLLPGAEASASKWKKADFISRIKDRLGS
ncbi:hypothetical protein SH501x_003192 [Pirellulaceae bacterium SH501]